MKFNLAVLSFFFVLQASVQSLAGVECSSKKLGNFLIGFHHVLGCSITYLTLEEQERWTTVRKGMNNSCTFEEGSSLMTAVVEVEGEPEAGNLEINIEYKGNMTKTAEVVLGGPYRWQASDLVCIQTPDLE